MLNRYSSKRGRPFAEMLKDRLNHAVSYDRIAGYFSSSILDIAGEEIEGMPGKTRVICNSELDVMDIKTAQLADQAQKREWCDFKPEELPSEQKRFQRLFTLLQSGKMEVRVLPREKFGLAHGKAGVITLEDGTRTSFLGSANETVNGWIHNYELVWEDDSEESVRWVQEEFDNLWNNEYAIPLSKAVINDIDRLSRRQTYSGITEWKNEDASPAASVAVESPVYRKSQGLWDHQKYFVDIAMKQHKTKGGARLINADQVGLGKTLQLAMSAMLMSLWDDKPVLAIVPKTLQKQWQDDILNLIGLSSAFWTGNGWYDENEKFYPLGIDQCPRRFGIISQGIISNGSESCRKQQEALLNLRGGYACVIVDECHRARRRNLSPDSTNQTPSMNRLYAYLCRISRKTHSMLLATATPVQINPVEAWDLLNILAQGSDSVLGTIGSKWRTVPNIQRGLDVVTGKIVLSSPDEVWEWLRNPLPLPVSNSADDNKFRNIRFDSGMADDDSLCSKLYIDLKRPQKSWLQNKTPDGELLRGHNPYIDHIIRRERGFLEETVNPETNLPFLQKINVVLYGESTEESVPLEGYLKEAYEDAETFCKLLQQRCRSAGLFKTQLLRRIGSSIVAGYATGDAMLKGWTLNDNEEDDEDEDSGTEEEKDLKNLSPAETEKLKGFMNSLSIAMNQPGISDPKLNRVLDILDNGVLNSDGSRTAPWKEYGCILFSQYFDTAEWVARSLSEHYRGMTIGLYAGGTSSKEFIDGIPKPIDKNDLKKAVANYSVRILVGTDAASEGLNLQTLGSLINIDLPWNPTRLEQRKGRIQRIGQRNNTVYIYNLKYSGSVEERVHELLSERLQNIHDMFGQVPDVLQDVWVDVAIGEINEAKKKIDQVPASNPFSIKYNRMVENVDWESCSKVLTMKEVEQVMNKSWGER